MLRRFPSLANPTEYGYSLDTDAYDHKAPVDAHFRMFKTFGDGLIQHSGDWAITVEFMADYLASLADILDGDEALLQQVSYSICQRPTVEQIEFAASVVYKPSPDANKYPKPRYFSTKELKISSSPSKQHDKRYEEIRDIHDGSAESIYRILIPEYADGLQRYAYASAIRDWIVEGNQKNRPYYMQFPGNFLKWFDDRDKGRDLKDAYEACYLHVESYRLKHSAKANLENYKRRVVKAKPAAESTESEVA